MKTNHWYLIGTKLGPDILCNKLKEYQQIVASISGLVAGFVFVVTNSNVTWNYKGIFGDELRTDLVGICFLSSLVFALGATLMALIIYGNINTFGPNKTMVLDFIEQRFVFLATPQILLIICLVLMILGTFFAVGGLFGDLVFYVYIVVVLCVLGFVAYYFLFEQAKINKTYTQLLMEMPDIDAE